MRPKHVAFVDTESTGTDPSRHEVIELAVAVTDLGMRRLVLPPLSVKIRPERPEHASPEALAVNGYTPEAWEGAVTAREALERLGDLMRLASPPGGERPHPMLAGHNVQFDLAFLREAHRRAGLEMPRTDYRHLDTMSLAFPLLAEGRTDSISLDAVCRELGIGRPSPHRALDDALASMEVARRMLEERTWIGMVRRWFRRSARQASGRSGRKS